MPGFYESLVIHGTAVALSPLPIAALIFLLLSKKPKTNGLGFLAGWFIALILNMVMFVFLFQAAHAPQGTDPVGLKLFHGALGALLILFAVNEWVKRPKKGKRPHVPAWMQVVSNFNFVKSFVIAASLVTINAKNTVVNVTAGNLIAQNAHSFPEEIYAIILFSCIASLSILIPVIAFFVWGDHLKKVLGKINVFFIQNSNVILSILFLFLGISLLAKAF